MVSVLEIINNVSIIMECFIPGFLFLSILNHIIGLKFEKELYELMLSVIVSFISRSFFLCLNNLIPISLLFSDGESLALICLLSCIISLIICILYRSKLFGNLFSKFFIKDIHSNIWESMIDFRKGTSIKVSLKSGEIITGGFYEIEENGNDSWLALSNYYFEFNKKTESSQEYKDMNLNTTMMIRVSDIDRVQFFTEMGQKQENAIY